MNISIEDTETILSLIQTEIGYWSAPEHIDDARYLEKIEKTFKKSLDGKLQYEKRMLKENMTGEE